MVGFFPAAGAVEATLERRTLSLNQENISLDEIPFRREVIRDAEAILA